MSVNPTDLLAQRHRSYRQARERHQRAAKAREVAQQRVAELESELARAESRDRVALGDALVDDRRPAKPEADSIRSRHDEAKRQAEALLYAEERAAGALTRLPREHKDEWLSAATRTLDNARAAYTDAIAEIARARDQLADEATLVSYLANEGQYTQAIGAGIHRPMSDGTTQTFDFTQLVELMRAEAGDAEQKARRDPSQPQPEIAFHLINSGGHKSWE